MTLTKTALLLTSLSVATTSLAVAQPRFCVGGSLDQLSVAERAGCDAKVQEVRSAAAHLQVPQNWHFIVVCDAQGWSDYRALASATGDTLLTSAAGTSVARQETFLRGEGDALQSAQAVKELLTSQLALTQGSKTLLAHQGAASGRLRTDVLAAGF